jgi:hypothetical protein
MHFGIFIQGQKKIRGEKVTWGEKPSTKTTG